MNLKDEIDCLSDLIMYNPLEGKKQKEVARKTLKQYDFFTQVYPVNVLGLLLEAVRTKKSIKPPPCIFMPSKKVIKDMVISNLKFSKKDTIENFLLRFGLLDNPNWYLK
jgi:hypothetical protein